jgi:hypothetical protein
MPEPWEQLRGEPKESYCRFLCYRNLGPARSLAMAYTAYLNTLPDAEAKQLIQVLKGVKKCYRCPGNWQQDSIRYRWNERARDWDIDQLLRLGDDIAPFWAQVLRDVIRKAAEALADPKFKPRQWKDVIIVLDKVSLYMNPEIFRAVQFAVGATTIPATTEAGLARSSTVNPEPPTPRRDLQPQRELTNEDVE